MIFFLNLVVLALAYSDVFWCLHMYIYVILCLLLQILFVVALGPIHTYHAVPLLFPCRFKDGFTHTMPFPCRSHAVPLPF
jgi:hypothetical protein